MAWLLEMLWGVPMVGLLLVVGVVMSLRTRFVQVRKLPAAIGQVGRSMRSTDRSAFRSVCTALAATVGTGNIAGVAGAISLGGPGAVFWMWVAAFFGMATKYAEVTLAVKHKTKDSKGGPMYYIIGGMGERFRPLAVAFALFAVLASFGMGNIAQINTISQSICQALPFVPRFPATLLTGVVTAAVVAAVTLGGVKRIGQVTEKIVPLMAAMYILSMLVVIVLFRHRLGQVMSDIFRGAFSPEAVLGGGVGITLRQALRMGVSRGVFSNEAGMGSAPIAHASSTLPAHEQGLMGIFEVFFDTCVLCTLTALAILSSGVCITYGEAAGVELSTEAMTTVFGSFAPTVQLITVTLLAFATMISWQLYGQRCAEFLGFGGYGMCYVAVIVLGATMDLSAAWAVADVCNALMCLPNLTALLLLGGKADWKTGRFVP